MSCDSRQALSCARKVSALLHGRLSRFSMDRLLRFLTVLAHDLFTRVMRNAELWLAYNVVHGDLSAFNILCWEGNVTIIDFP